jgi:hypothetical protein
MNTPVRRALLAGLVVFLATGCRDTVSVEPLEEPLLSRVTPGASFDWTMPPRFGHDGDGDGLLDYPRTAEEINPSSWTVDFDACGVPAGRLYIWHVNERRVASTTSCRYAHEFPAEGMYDVALHVVGDREPGIWAEHVVTVQDWLVVSFGDSYASGEGVPEIAQATDQLFQQLNGALQDLVNARRLLVQAAASLQEAFEKKGLAEAVLATAQQRRTNFFEACTPDDFKAIQRCADFLKGLPFDTFTTARDHFNQAVQNAQDRVNSAVTAYQQAVAAHASAQSAVNNLQAAIATLSAGLQPARWQVPYHNEDWEGEDCHRSANAAAAQAALALEESDPHTSVTFVHLACSGARVDMFRGSLRKQIPWAAELIGAREIDAVTVSIGGNDAGFVRIATACVVQQPCYVDVPAIDPAPAGQYCFLMGLVGFQQQCNDLFGVFPDQSAKGIVEEGVAGLPPRYEEVAQVLLPTLAGLLEPELGPGPPSPPLDPVDRVRSDRVYITEYVDMTTLDEMEWLDVVAAGSINQAVEDAAEAHGWTAVDQIYQAYDRHGYCATNHWVVRAHETFIRQGDESGMAHPNLQGLTHNGQAIFSALIGDLYPLGLGEPPRAPDEPAVPTPPMAP